MRRHGWNSSDSHATLYRLGDRAKRRNELDPLVVFVFLCVSGDNNTNLMDFF